jgi:hypothetical protein
LRDTRRSSKPEYRARYPDARPFFATRIPVSVRTSQTWLRWFNSAFAFAFGLQALQRCSGLLNRRARGGTVATHHFADVAQQRQQQFCKLPGIAPRECKSLRRPHFASVVKLLSSSASNGEFAGGSPAGCTNFIGALAQQKRRPAQTGKVEGANPSRATNFISLP